jgi:glycosyltransferase involved in cell wall biosynthesis
VPARLILDVFTPLPPLPTEIANHSAAMLPALAALAEVRVWTAQDSWLPVPGVAVHRFSPYAIPFPELNQADATFFNLGNNAPFHAAIYHVARQKPGIVILHDTNMQHFFAYHGTHGPENAPLYLEAMRRWYGPAAEAEAAQLIAGTLPIEALAARYPLTLEAAEGAIGIVTHNEAESLALARMTRLPVYQVPLSFDLKRVPPPRAFQRREGPPWRLLVFGFIGNNRRLQGILHALARSEVRHLFVLDVYGVLEQPEAFDALVNELGLAAQVVRHGFVERVVLEQALARADLALNLRYPTMGEASSSQLHIWANALPTLVSRVGWYAALPEDTVFHVDPAREVEDIQAHLAAFARDRAPFDAAGQRGRERLLALHGTERYAEGLVEIAREAPVQHSRRAAVDMARTATRHLLELAGADAMPLLTQPIAERIATLCASRAEAAEASDGRAG